MNPLIAQGNPARRLAVVARTFYKLKSVGLKPDMQLTAAAVSLGLLEGGEIVTNCAARLLRKIGVPHNDEQLASPAFRRDAECAMSFAEVQADLGAAQESKAA